MKFLQAKKVLGTVSTYLLIVILVSSFSIAAYPRKIMALSDAQKKLYQSGVYQFDIDVPTNNCSVDASGESYTMVGNSNAEKAYRYFVDKPRGLPDFQSAGIVGNLMGESSVNPRSSVNGNGTIGIAQWEGGRDDALKEFAAKKGKPWHDLLVQLDYLWYELNHSEKAAFEHLKSTKTVEEATTSFVQKFERAGIPHTEKRIKLAQSALNDFGGESGDSTDEVSAPSADCQTDSIGGSTFRIGSFNIYYSTDDSKPAYSKQQYKERLNRSAGVIKDENIEVVGLQEVRENQWSYIQDSSVLGGSYDIYPNKYGSAGYAAQNPIIWKRDRFSLVEGKSIPGYTVTGGRNPKANTQVLLKDKSSGQEFYLINSHEPVSEKGREGKPAKDKLEAAKEKSDYVKKLQDSGGKVFLTGDFNQRRNGQGQQPVYQGSVNNTFYCILTDNNLMVHVKDSTSNKSGKCPDKDNEGPDQIYMTKGIIATKYDYKTHTPKANGSDSHNTLFADVTIPGSSGGPLSENESLPNFKTVKVTQKTDGPPPGNFSESKCTKGFTVGAQSLSDVILDKYKPPVTRVGGFDCRRNTNDPTTSIHGVGRALDIMVNGNNPQGKETGDKIRNYLINNSEALGIQVVIWNRQIWSAQRNKDGLRAYDGPSPHTDHVHAEINVAASKNPKLGR